MTVATRSMLGLVAMSHGGGATADDDGARARLGEHRVDDTPRLLKAFVIVGGILLLAGTVLLVLLLVMRVGDEAAVVHPLPAEVALPPGTRVERIALDGRRLVLLAVDGSGRQLLVVVDAITGERQGLLELQPEE